MFYSCNILVYDFLYIRSSLAVCLPPPLFKFIILQYVKFSKHPE